MLARTNSNKSGKGDKGAQKNIGIFQCRKCKANFLEVGVHYLEFCLGTSLCVCVCLKYILFSTFLPPEHLKKFIF